MRDWKKLRVFQAADEQVLYVFNASKQWPSEHRFGLTSQMQRAALSVASNLVEGCSRSTQAEYIRFVEIAYSSCCECAYQLSVAQRLGFAACEDLHQRASALSRQLGSLLVNLRSPGERDA